MEAYAQDAETIPKDKLEPFLRSRQPDQFTWRRLPGPDFYVYYGTANFPLNGSVGFYVGWAPRPLPTNVPTSRSKLGQFRVRWHRTASDDGLIHQETIVSLGDTGQIKAHVWVAAQNETQLSSLLAAAGQLPIFASGALPHGYDVIEARMSQEQRVRRIIWGIWWTIVLTTGWCADRMLRRRKLSAARRMSIFSINVAVWIAITIALIVVSGSIAIDQSRKANVPLLLAAAILLVLIGFFLATVLSLVARRRTRRKEALATEQRN